MRRALRYAVFLFVFALPFGTKKFITALIPQMYEYVREFSSLLLYATDIVALLLIVFALIYGGRRFARTPFVKWFCVFGALLITSLFFALNFAYSAYVAASIILALLVACAIAFVVSDGVASAREIFKALAASATLQALIAILQFYYQKSVGLWILGESVITATTQGVARVNMGGVNFLRAYGTLPHANILAGFLVMGLIACAYLYLTAPRRHPIMHAGSAMALFTILSALVFTFSRSGWIVAAIVILAIGIYSIWNKKLRASAREYIAVVLVSLFALSLVLGSAIVSRAGFTKGEFSIDHRIYYNEIGLTLVREHPLGVGIGNEVLRAAQEGLFAAKGLTQTWLWQPVHNIYILIASELGIAGLLVFLALLFIAFRRIDFSSPEAVFAGLLVVSLLLFGFVDHFPWDLHAGRLMFWTAFGIMMGLGARVEKPL